MVQDRPRIVVTILVQQPVQTVWQYWTKPEHIREWNIPFPNWYCPVVTNDLQEGGRFCFCMKTKDDLEGFAHAGIYNRVQTHELLSYTLDDGRQSTIEFQQIDQNTIVRESFEPEPGLPLEMQEKFCQSVLEKFKNYVEGQ